jgi:hypothetical protein
MSGSRDRRGILVAIAIAVAAAGGIALVQPGLARDVHAVKQRDDVFVLPPEKQLRAVTFGYHAAATDLLWAWLLVEYGTHHQEKRRFPNVHRYIEGILVLEPDFAVLYQFLDTLLVFAPGGTSIEDVRSVRTYFERGLQVRPYDADLWLHYGQFLAFLAPSYLPDKAETERWRLDGARAIMRAVELGSDPERSLAAATILSKAGEGRANLRNLERLYALADDPETRRQILLKIQQLEGTLDSERAVNVVTFEWHKRYPFMSRSATLLLGPHRSPAACAGPSSYDRKVCPRDWEMAVGDQ